MLYTEYIDEDPLVQESTNELQNAIDDYILAKSYNDENLDELAQIVFESEQKVINSKKLSLLKRMKAKLATLKKNKDIVEKYKDRALSADLSGVTVKVYDTSSQTINKYISACNTCIKEINSIYKPYLKKESLTKDEKAELNAKVADAISKRNAVIKEVENTTEKCSTVKSISTADVKKAISYLSGKVDSAAEKQGNKYVAALDVMNNIDKSKSKIEQQYEAYINGCKFSIECAKYNAIIHSAQNARIIITTAAYANSKKNKDEK